MYIPPQQRKKPWSLRNPTAYNWEITTYAIEKQWLICGGFGESHANLLEMTEEVDKFLDTFNQQIKSWKYRQPKWDNYIVQ